MRLTQSQVEIIKAVTSEVWGEQTMVYLFGSRTEDFKKGGDIDLYIHLKEDWEPKQIMLQKAKFLSKLEILLGEQKIDLLVKTSYNSNLPIIKTAQLKGVAL